MLLQKSLNLASLLINKMPYAKTILAKIGVSKIISYGQQSGLAYHNHYSDKYWNDLDTVQKYINKNATGNDDTIWQIDLLTRFSEKIPFKKCLIIGCGNGWVERQLYDLNIGLDFDAFDISEKYLKEAKEKKENRSIKYYKDDLNNLEKLPQNYYDAIFNVGVLHHGFRLSRTLWHLNRSLKPNGLMFNFDYVGPAQNNYSENHLQLLNQINKKLPKRFQSPHRLRPAKEDFTFGDPTEAVNADLVRPTFERFFDVIYQRDLNGGIAYQILWNNISNFENNIDLDSKKWLNYILEKDLEMTKEGKIPVLFWYGVGKPKSKDNIFYNELLPV